MTNLLSYSFHYIDSQRKIDVTFAKGNALVFRGEHIDSQLKVPGPKLVMTMYLGTKDTRHPCKSSVYLWACIVQALTLSKYDWVTQIRELDNNLYFHGPGHATEPFDKAKFDKDTANVERIAKSENVN